MKVFVLGGTGQFGREVARKLTAYEIVSEVVIAGRSIEAAKDIARQLGAKATAVQADILDEKKLGSLIRGHDLVVNIAGPERKVVLPAIRAAIEARVNYCDICGNGRVAEKALSLDAVAKKAEMTALVGIGEDPGLSNLMMMHAAQQLDVVDDLRFCILFVVGLYGGGPEPLLAKTRKAGHSDANWQNIMGLAGPQVRLYRHGNWLEVNPIKYRVSVDLPNGGSVTAHPIGVSEPITLPRYLRNIKSVSVLASLHPPELNERWCELSGLVNRGELGESEAAVRLFEDLASMPGDSIKAPKGCEDGWVVWTEAIGSKHGERAQYKCWPEGNWFSTVGPIAVASLKMLRGEINKHGVVSPESCLDPMPFFTEVAEHTTPNVEHGRLLNESIRVLARS